MDIYGEGTKERLIKALIVFKENGGADNLFVPILSDVIRTSGIDVKYSSQEFWRSDTAYDIIHFQWPEEVVGKNPDTPAIIDRLKERIAYFRSKGARFVYTRHNVRPRSGNDILAQAYDVIETESDAIAHMGRYGLDEFIAGHPGKRHVVIPHHLYEYTFNENFSTERARQFLNLPQDAFIITVLSEFHDHEERRVVMGAFREWEEERKLLLAPRLYPFSRLKSYGSDILKRYASRLGYNVLMPIINHWTHTRGGASDEVMDGCDLPSHIAASDVIMIQRKEPLNSEDALLGFLFHKIVIGPDTGNVGELLRQTGNPVFDPNDRWDIIRAMSQARQMAVWFKGEANYSYAKENMNIKKTGREYAGLYKELADK